MTNTLSWLGALSLSFVIGTLGAGHFLVGRAWVALVLLCAVVGWS